MRIYSHTGLRKGNQNVRSFHSSSADAMLFERMESGVVSRWTRCFSGFVC